MEVRDSRAGRIIIEPLDQATPKGELLFSSPEGFEIREDYEHPRYLVLFAPDGECLAGWTDTLSIGSIRRYIESYRKAERD